MDYAKLAAEFLEWMHLLRKLRPQKNFGEAIQGEAFILQYLANHDADVLPGEIGKEMNVSSARIAQALNSIEKKGLITRAIDKRDRRQIRVQLTAAGRSAADEHLQEVIGHTTRMLQSLGEEDAKEYVRITAKLVQLMPHIIDDSE